jgi:hypothetical protein
MPSPRSRATALVRAEHDRPAVKLDPPQRKLLAEALRRGEDLREEVESRIGAFGRWLLESVFANDTSAALDLRADNPVWLELVRRAGGPTLAVSRRLLYVALHLAARDKRIADQTWRGLDAGRKELLLPLADDERMREAARHVAKFNLTHQDTRAYVAELTRGAGRPRAVRLTAPRLSAQVKKLRAGLARPAVLARVAELRGALDEKARAELVEEIERLRATLGDVTKALGGRR